MSVIDTVYVERGIASHPQTARILKRFSGVRRIECERYGEVFNPRAQNFRLQKARPALILAAKHDGHVLEAPSGYSIGGERNFYFSHMLNCPYDCRYCFLQGMYQSAHQVLFVNYESYMDSIDACLDRLRESEVYFFSGYDCDSLAFDGVSGFCDAFLPFFAARPRAWLELRTKSARTRSLIERRPFDNCVVAFSFTPELAHASLEGSVPSVERRIEALCRLGERGWRLGLRFDPLIYWQGYREAYDDLFAAVFARLDPDWIHSVSLGVFRLPKPFFDRMTKLYPEEPLFAGPLEGRESAIAYRRDLEEEMVTYCAGRLSEWVAPDRFFSCTIAAT